MTDRTIKTIFIEIFQIDILLEILTFSSAYICFVNNNKMHPADNETEKQNKLLKMKFI